MEEKVEQRKQQARPTGGSVLLATLTVALSLRARGVKATAVLTALGLGLPALAEYSAVNLLRGVRHHGQPQVAGVPVSAVLGWFNITCAAHALAERMAHLLTVSPGQQRWLVPLSSAAVATSLDLLLDVYGLDEGLWEWRDGGPYAREVVGPNGKRGIPVSNFVAWVGLTGLVTGLYELVERPERGNGDAWVAGGRASARCAALLLLPKYGLAAGRAVRRRRPVYLVASALAPLAAAWAAWGSDA
jgi:uncharacterized membrane protein